MRACINYAAAYTRALIAQNKYKVNININKQLKTQDTCSVSNTMSKF